ncbi:MAG: FAD binding domain-containing protein, partial [Actinobacteria bacterium]|nr:FAD binding domain-containing protein [Actinomycetota bacterium]
LVAADFPALRTAALSVGARPIRARATVGGNVTTARDDHSFVPVLLALEARITVRDESGERTLPLADFIADSSNGSAHPSDVLITSISVDRVDGPQLMYRVGPRNGPCYATASIALVVDRPAKRIRLALGGAGATCVRAAEAEEMASSACDWATLSLSGEAAQEFGQLAARAVSPKTDPVASGAYRKHAIEVMARRAISRVLNGEA